MIGQSPSVATRSGIAFSVVDASELSDAEFYHKLNIDTWPRLPGVAVTIHSDSESNTSHTSDDGSVYFHVDASPGTEVSYEASLPGYITSRGETTSIPVTNDSSVIIPLKRMAPVPDRSFLVTALVWVAGAAVAYFIFAGVMNK